ncbi:MAG TPA: ABC transporter permease [Eubacteriales bacterium]|nr:ABC transporter permease [Clostridia bacterium]HRV73883.1 ABC transporter permease [Eubacteriales bacterium]
MAKNVTPEMTRINARRTKNGKVRRSTPSSEAWFRLMRNKTAVLGLVLLLALFTVAIFAPQLTKYGYDEVHMPEKLQGPSLEHPFGTDQLGRDMLSRCFYGARTTLPIALCAVVFAITVGGLLGIISAYFGGATDNIIMRIIDIWGSIPGIMLAIAIVACLGNNEIVLVIGLSMGAVPNMARTFRGAIFTVIDSDYVESSKAMGASNLRIMFKHLVPNAVGPVIIAIVGLLGIEVLCVSALSFVGVGIAPPTPEWGSLLSTGRQYLTTHAYLCFFPGLFIMLAVLGFNLLGDGLRDALDPRLK